MLPPFLGFLLVLATAAGVGISLLVGLWGVLTGHRPLVRGALLAGGGMAGLYALFWVGGLALTHRTVLEPGQSVSFCGLDCHLHVSVDAVHPGPELGVTVRFSSDARQAPEWPGELLFRLEDASGKEYSPTNPAPDRVLRAGESWTHELRFPAEATPAGAVLLVTWKGGLDYLVPGAGNPLVQRRRRLALPTAKGAGT